MREKRLRDVVRFGMSPDDIAAQLLSIGAAITGSTQWIKEHRPRDERNLVLFNLLIAPVPYIGLYAQNLSGPLALLAFCTRTVFELNVRTRHVLLSPANLKQWMAEAADDHVELLKAIIGIAEPDDPRAGSLRHDLQRIEGLKVKHKLPELRKADTQIAALAREINLEQEHKSLFKIFSKLVHPTAYLVNSANVMEDAQMRNVLLVHFQIYALDLFKRITDEIGVPSEVTSGSLGKHTSKSHETDQIQ